VPRPATDLLPELFSLPEVAFRIGLSAREVRDGALEQRFDHYLIGKVRWMDNEQIQALLDSLVIRAVEQVPAQHGGRRLAKTRAHALRLRTRRAAAA
jgi:hypothetical protein